MRIPGHDAEPFEPRIRRQQIPALAEIVDGRSIDSPEVLLRLAA